MVKEASRRCRGAWEKDGGGRWCGRRGLGERRRDGKWGGRESRKE